MKKYTVMGIWMDDEPYAVGAVGGDLEVDGDTLDYADMSPWAMSVDATSAQDACERAVEAARAENAALEDDLEEVTT